ncbi:MAG TPA: DUF1427 family protein [Acetobacteraceae bacterium]|jgi:XapX domain-containing protein|nr:DUF1427 family protein [Acetobacteraceae bacterium]
MKPVLGILVAFAVGFACRWFGIPSPAPPVLTGALLVLAMTLGYTATDKLLATRAKQTDACAGPTGQSVQTGETL